MCVCLLWYALSGQSCELGDEQVWARFGPLGVSVLQHTTQLIERGVCCLCALQLMFLGVCLSGIKSHIGMQK